MTGIIIICWDLNKAEMAIFNINPLNLPSWTLEKQKEIQKYESKLP